MMARLRRVLAPLNPPVFPDDEEKTRKAAYANSIALTFTGVILAYGLYLLYATPVHTLGLVEMVLLVLIMVGVLSWWLVRRGHVSIASILLVGLIWAGTNGIAASGFGIRDSSYILNFVVMLIAALLLGWRAAIIIALASTLAGFGLAYGEAAGFIVPPEYSVTSFSRDIAVVLGLAAYFIYILITGLENAIRQSRSSLQELETTNTELHHAQADLRARSLELTEANQALQKRTERLRAVAEVARAATAVQNFNQLLPLITNIISQQLGYYHIGIFLVDEMHEYAILRAANTDGGLRMLARGHRLKIGEQGLVGFVTRTGTPRKALDVEQDTAFFDNPDLPDTRSELVLPLTVSGSIIGALDLQSTERNAFDEEDTELLTILADQIAVAIQNSLSLEQAQLALREAEFASRQIEGMVWRGYTGASQVKGFRYDGVKSEPLKEVPGLQRDPEVYYVPVQLRGQTIGRLKLKSSDNKRNWTEDERAIIESTAERLALALESARLLDEAQKRAAREVFLSEVGTRLGASFQLDSILRDTVEELGQSLKGSTVSFQLINPSAPPSIDSTESGNGRSAPGQKSD